MSQYILRESSAPGTVGIYGKSDAGFPHAIYITRDTSYREVVVTFVDLGIETSTSTAGVCAVRGFLHHFVLDKTLQGFSPCTISSCFSRKLRRYFIVAARAAGEKCAGRHVAENNRWDARCEFLVVRANRMV